MSLTFQLVRGGLALALVFALSVTAWLAPAASGTSRAILGTNALGTDAPVTEAASVTVCPVPPPALRLALSPADLPASRRANGSCRA